MQKHKGTKIAETILIIDIMKITRDGMTTFSIKLGREISKHHEDKGILSNEQDEFITNKSCLTKLIVV